MEKKKMKSILSMGFNFLRRGLEHARCRGRLPDSSVSPLSHTSKAKAKGKSSSMPPCRHHHSVKNPPPSTTTTAAPPLPVMYGVSPPAFQSVEEIGKGSFGVVVKAKDLDTGDLVAIKQIHLDDDRMSCLLADNGLSRLPEVNHHSSCSRHHAIVRLRGAFIHHHTVFIVMDYIPQDLRLLLRNDPLLFDEHGVRKIMTQLLSGLAYIHRKRIIHRDIKPANILVNPEKGVVVVKICDFGLARSFQPGLLLPPLSRPAGTRPYCAPEMLAGKEYSEAIDVWSAGCVMAEMLTGDMLFRANGLAEQLDLIHKTMAVDGLHDEGGLRDRIPPTLLSRRGFDLLTCLLAVDPRERITAKEALSHPWFC